jgi:TrwC relaxase
MAPVAKGYDLDYAWRAVGEAYRGAGYYLAAAEAGEPPGTWWGPGAERLGFATGEQVEREPYNLLFRQRKGPDGQKLGRAPGNAGKAAQIYQRLLAAEPGADDHGGRCCGSRRSGRPGSRRCISISRFRGRRTSRSSTLASAPRSSAPGTTATRTPRLT